MRTTLDIADDVLLAARKIARRERKPIGHVISDLARQAFTNPQPGLTRAPRAPARDAPRIEVQLASYGIKPVASRGDVISNELIDRLRDAEGI
jgi:hypothetical protein